MQLKKKKVITYFADRCFVLEDINVFKQQSMECWISLDDYFFCFLGIQQTNGLN